MQLEFSQQIFQKDSDIKFYENRSSGSRVFPCGQTDRHEANSRFYQFCERASKLFFRQHRAVQKQYIWVALVATVSSVRLTHSRKTIIV
jgi:hypothetical protein